MHLSNILAMKPRLALACLGSSPCCLTMVPRKRPLPVIEHMVGRISGLEPRERLSATGCVTQLVLTCATAKGIEDPWTRSMGVPESLFSMGTLAPGQHHV